jgi:hypothetical protein
MTLADGTILPMEWVQKRQGRDMPVKGKMDRFFIPREHKSWNNITEQPYKKLFEEV